MIFIGIMVLVFLADWQIKKYAEKELDHTDRKVCGDRIILRKLHNYGVALGMMKEKPKAVLKMTAAVIAVIFAFSLNLLGLDGANLQKAGLALMLGGGINNLADRKKNGYVRDYFSFNVKWKKLRRLVFNLSDMFVFLGAALLAIGELYGKSGKAT